MHLFASLLGLQKRGVNDPALVRYLDQDSRPACFFVDLTGDSDRSSGENGLLPEVEQSSQLVRSFRGRTLHLGHLHSTATIQPAIIAKETAAWRAWHRQSREEHRAKRAANGGSHGRVERRRRPRLGKNDYRRPRDQRHKASHEQGETYRNETYDALRNGRSAGGRRVSRSRSPVRERRESGSTREEYYARRSERRKDWR